MAPLAPLAFEWSFGPTGSGTQVIELPTSVLEVVYVNWGFTALDRTDDTLRLVRLNVSN